MATKPRAQREPTPELDTSAEPGDQTPDALAVIAEPMSPAVVVDDAAPSSHVTVKGTTYTRADAVLLGLVPPSGA